MSDPPLWHFMSPLHPKGASRTMVAKPETILPREPDRIANPRGPQRSGDVLDTARYFLRRGIVSRDIIARLLGGWDQESVKAVIREVEQAEATKRDQAVERPKPKARARVKSALFAMLVVPGFLAIAVLGGSETIVSMPPYAAVYLDDATRTYVALPCMAEWSKRPTKIFVLARLSTAGEARKLRYDPDDVCVQTGAFIEEESPIAFILVKLGILPPTKYWWDAPYRTETGVVIPGRER